MEFTEHEKGLLFDHYLKREKHKQEDQFDIYNNAWGKTIDHGSRYIGAKTEIIKLDHTDLDSVTNLINSIERTPQTLGVYFEEYYEQEEGCWVNESGINLVIVTVEKTKATPEDYARCSLEWACRDYSWKSEKQPGGKDVRMWENMVKKLLHNSDNNSYR